MIPKETIDEIFNTARIDEVIGEYVHLKKRGANLLGNCPFHGEKTPSFTVSPVKGIYKCFGCGVSGNSVTFLMEHEHYSYPEALKFLASKYNIFIEEEVLTPEKQMAQNDRESMYVVANYAEKYFSEQLFETNPGRAIGLSYFKERGFSEETIKKFQLGYSPEGYDTFTKEALQKGYKQNYLEDSGLTKNKNNKVYDGYRGRVIFPIHNLSGRALGFGGRILKLNEKAPKYINSPENIIYDKSKVLYGLFTAKRAILQKDNCFLVEGYTDVVSMYQAGIENVVSSSGTSLTDGQINLIDRFTKNITILYDGDLAGIKASFRGINMILQHGLNVRVVLFPDGEDPDSFARKSVPGELDEFVTKNAKDFIVFKTDLLLEETQGDPIKKAKLVHEIVDTIALIPDEISRNLYVKECARLMELSEPVIIAELNKVIRKIQQKGSKEKSLYPEEASVVPFRKEEQVGQGKIDGSTESLEKNIIRLLLQYGNHKIWIEVPNEKEEKEKQGLDVIVFIINLLYRDDVAFENEVYQQILNEYIVALNEEKLLEQDYFIKSQNPEISKVAIDLISEKYELHNWESKQIYVESEEKKLRRAVEGSIYAYFSRKVEIDWQKNQDQLKALPKSSIDEMMKLLRKQKELNSKKQDLSQFMGRIIVR